MPVMWLEGPDTRASTRQDSPWPQPMSRRRCPGGMAHALVRERRWVKRGL